MAETNYTKTIPEAPLPISMVPRAKSLNMTDIILVTQPTNVQGQRTKGATLQQISDTLVAPQAVVVSNILEFNGDLPAISASSRLKVVEMNIHPAYDVEFFVWGTSDQAETGVGGPGYEYGLAARTWQCYDPDDIDRYQDQFAPAGHRFGFREGSLDSDRIVDVGTPRYMARFTLPPYDYYDDYKHPEVLKRYPTKKVRLFLSSGVNFNPYQAEAPKNFKLNIQARLTRAQFAMDLLQSV